MIDKLKKLCCFAIRYAQLILAWVALHTAHRNLLRQNIWLIREKRDEARDNGYHFYKYIRETHPEENAFFVITQDSPDRHKVEKYGNLIKADSWEHCIYFLAARFSISSQQYGAYPFHFTVRMMNYVQKLCNRRQKVVFLQHGIIKDKFPAHEFSYELCNIDYFVTSTQREYTFIKDTYQYPEHAIGCLGLARFDYLHTPHSVEKKILVMPTWRRWLDVDKKMSLDERERCFSGSDYFKAYAALLTDEELIHKLRNHGYKLVFYLHYKMQPYVACLKAFENDVVVIAEKTDFDVQTLLMSSKLMITDYSSVYFDFAYMNKPVVYYQFDNQKFRESHYAEGYFSYKEDGFGPCFETWELMRQYVFEMIENQCCQPKEYDLRVKEFFTLRDNHNCERTYHAVKALEER